MTDNPDNPGNPGNPNDGKTRTYEMLWDCEYCGKPALLGKTHRYCPECGGAQNPEKRYFPPEDKKVAVEDHVYTGADLKCPACGTPGSAAVKFCGECAHPLEGAQEVKRIADQPADSSAQKTA